MSDLEKNPYEVFDRIVGQDLEDGIVRMASIGGEILPPTDELKQRYSPTRLALSDEDFEGRDHIHMLMEESGLEIDSTHPLFLRGVLPGKDRELASVLVLSHYDTVPRADMYDGVAGVLGGLAVTKAIKDSGVQLERDVEVLALTGEESSRFKIALFGSKAAFLGLSEEDVAMSDSNGDMIQDILTQDDLETTFEPVYGPEFWQRKKPIAAIELHVEQATLLEEKKVEIGVVESIAAPIRHIISIGDTEQVPFENTLPAQNSYKKLTIHGSPDHSGSTPMGRDNRSDGLVEAAELLLPMLRSKDKINGLDISGIEIEDQALNKIPGKTTIEIHIGANTEEELEIKKELFDKRIKLRQEQFRIEVAEYEPDEQTASLSLNAMRERYASALEVVLGVNEAAEAVGSLNVVGTVGTLEQNEKGQIKLGLDVRGIDTESRQQSLDDIAKTIEEQKLFTEIEMGMPLAGSGDPVSMDPDLVKLAERAIQENDLATTINMFSPAGHDAQNAARAGIPTVMLFVPSRDGIAHNPNAYTSPENLEKGTRALAAILIKLASKKTSL